MDGEGCWTPTWEVWSNSSELVTYNGDAHPGPFVADQQVEYERSPDSWNYGTSAHDLSNSACIDPRLLFRNVSTGISTQAVPGQDLAGLGSADGLQGAINTL